MAHKKEFHSSNFNIRRKKKEFKVKLNKGEIEILYANKENNKLRRNNREFPSGLVVRILGFHCCDPGPGWRTEVPQDMQHDRKKKKK